MADKEVSREAVKKPQSSEIRIPKKILWISLGVLVALALILGVVRGHIYRSIWSFVVPASANFTVVDSGTSTPIVGASITVNGSKLTTDKVGKADMYHLWVGSIPVMVEAPGYVTLSTTIKFHKGANPLTEKLVKDVRMVTFNGKVTDYVSDQALSGVNVKIDSGEIKSAADGTFSFTNVPVGTVAVTLSNSGYKDNVANVSLTDDSVQTVSLAPNGSTVFVSNRDSGKRGLYVSSFDGKDVKYLTPRIKDTEDYDVVVGPHNVLAAFLSTRDKRVSGGSSQYDPKLYLVGTDGTGLKKLTDDDYIYDVQWTADGRYLVWIGNDGGTADSATHARVYDPIHSTTTTLDNSGEAGSVWLNHSGTGAAWSQIQLKGQGATGVFYKELSSGSVKTVTDNSNAYNIQFSSDDKSITYQTYDSATQQTANERYTIATGETQAYSPEPSVNNITRITAASPDGKKIAYVEERDGQSDLFVSDSNGSNEQRLTHLGTLTGIPTWDPSGKYLLVDSAKTGETARYVVAIAGGSPKKVADISLDPNQMGY